jgi:hypothetical protein
MALSLASYLETNLGWQARILIFVGAGGALFQRAAKLIEARLEDIDLALEVIQGSLQSYNIRSLLGLYGGLESSKLPGRVIRFQRAQPCFGLLKVGLEIGHLGRQGQALRLQALDLLPEALDLLTLPPGDDDRRDKRRC